MAISMGMVFCAMDADLWGFIPVVGTPQQDPTEHREGCRDAGMESRQLMARNLTFLIYSPTPVHLEPAFLIVLPSQRFFG